MLVEQVAESPWNRWPNRVECADEAKAMLAGGVNPAVLRREARIEAAQQKALVKFETKPPSFRLSIADNALTIQTQSNKLTLSPEQTDAVRTFLIATPNEVKS